MIDEKNCGCNFRVSNCKKCKKDYCNHYKSVSPFLCCYCVQDILKEYLNNTDRDCVNLDNNGYYCVQDILKEYLNNTDFNLDNDEYFNNILDSEINGQYKQMREYFFKLNNTQKGEFFKWLESNEIKFNVARLYR